MLFPELARPANGLVGIARLASEATALANKSRVEYRQLATRRFIGRASGQRVPFDWTINPYRGCEFGCKYCYARYAHEFMELREPEQFEREIFIKTFDAVAFRRELARIPKAEPIAIGTATDPYQPAERQYQITRQILTAIGERSGHRIGIATKSALVARDVDLLAAIAERNFLHVSMTITTVHEGLARVLEPFAPSPAARLAAMRRLTEADIEVSVLSCPVMPLINDSYESLSAVARAAAEAGATSIHGNVLFLKPCAQRAFFPMLEERFPHLLRRYRERYEQGDGFIRGPYIDIVRQRLERIREETNLNPRSKSRVWQGEQREPEEPL
jgi:DNA repair photolyase